jgi:hypothetical protein
MPVKIGVYRGIKATLSKKPINVVIIVVITTDVEIRTSSSKEAILHLIL